ncbi:VMA21 [Sanghuangporus sanghuang]
MSEQAAASRITEETVQGGALFRLIFFAISLAVIPLSTYYGSQRFLWNGDSTFAAISAVFAANLVLLVYIVLSVYEDKKLNEPRKGDEQTRETRKDK